MLHVRGHIKEFNIVKILLTCKVYKQWASLLS
jgi:hypothetical protein